MMYQQGDRVQHPKLGMGTVKELKPETSSIVGPTMLVTFDRGGAYSIPINNAKVQGVVKGL